MSIKFKKKTVGSVSADFRKIKKISQKKMACDLKIEVDELRIFEESTEFPDQEFFKKICDYLDVTPTAIFLKVLNREDHVTMEQRVYFDAAEPIVDKLIYFLLSAKKPENTVPVNKRKISQN